MMKNRKVLCIGVNDFRNRMSGGNERNRQIVNLLSNEFEVTYLAHSLEDWSESDGHNLQFASYGHKDCTCHKFSFSQARIVRSLVCEHALQSINSIFDINRPDVIIFLNSYFASAIDIDKVPRVLFLPDLEVYRFRSLAKVGRLSNRLSSLFEYYKACWWEHRAIESSDLAVAISEVDERMLQKWSENTAVLSPPIPKGKEIAPKVSNGKVLIFGNFEYRPNQFDAESFIMKVWPTLKRSHKRLQLSIAGFRATDVRIPIGDEYDEIEVIESPEDIFPLIDNAQYLLFPVRHGAGRQIKVLYGLSRNRIAIMTPYSFDSVPHELRELCYVGNNVNEFLNIFDLLEGNLNVGKSREYVADMMNLIDIKVQNQSKLIVDEIAQLIEQELQNKLNHNEDNLDCK